MKKDCGNSPYPIINILRQIIMSKEIIDTAKKIASGKAATIPAMKFYEWGEFVRLIKFYQAA